MFWVISAASRPRRSSSRERVVAGVRLGAAYRVAERAHPVLFGREPLFPVAARDAQEALVAVHRRLAVLRPEAAGTAERRDAALDREPRAGQRHPMRRPRDERRRARDRGVGGFVEGEVAGSLKEGFPG